MVSELFNQKTIDKRCSNITVSAKQKKAANEWLKLLESDSLKDEKKNYFRFADIILKDLLGYDTNKNLVHEEGNLEFAIKGSDGKFVVGFEAKGTGTKLDVIQYGRKKEHETAIKQMWNYMGGKLDLAYGVVTNYKEFILLDKSKGTYLKRHLFDFTKIKNNENKLKEFIVVFSKEKVVDDNNFLEKLYTDSVVEEREFTKQFYKLYHETRLMFLKEFQDNGVSKEEALHYAQLYLNRLMFVFFAEDTDRLENRIFEKIITKHLNTENIFSENTSVISDAINGFFKNLDKGYPPENIFGFNGGLFQEDIPRTIYFNDLKKKHYFD